MDSVLTPDLPVAAAEDLTARAPIIVLAPHPDDESLGCGALLTHAFAHHGAHVVSMTDGGGSHPGSQAWPPARLSACRRQELVSAIEALGGTEDDLTWLGHTDGWLHEQPDGPIVDRIVALCQARQAKHLFAPAAQDHHADHRTTARIAHKVRQALPDITVFSYPVWSRWDDPDLLAQVADLSPLSFPVTDPEAKRRAITAHRSQCGAVVTDDPAGFTLDADFITMFATQPELYWSAP